MFASLRTRNFRIYVTGQLISNIGGWTQRIAQDWLVLSLTSSATAVGITTALQFLPTLFFGPLGGMIADRYPKRNILLITQTVMGICAAVLAVLTVTNSIQVWHIYLVATILGMATAVDNPTRQSFVNEMVGPVQLRNAISLNSAAFQLGALVGPAVSGVLIGLVGIGMAFAVNSASFLGALTALVLVRRGDLHPTVSSQRGHGQVRAAARYMRASPQMWWPMVLVAAYSLFTTSFPVTLASMSSAVFHSDATGFAFLTCMLAIGSVVGSLYAARRGPVRLRGLVALAFALSLAQLVASVAPGMAALAVALLAVGLASVLFGVSANATVQLAAGDHIRGRVMGIYLLAVVGAGCIGGPLVGAINEHLGPRMGLMTGALLPGIVTVIVAGLLVRNAGADALPEARHRVVVAGGRALTALMHAGR